MNGGHNMREEAMAAQMLLADLRAKDEALSEEDALCAVSSETNLEEAATATIAMLDRDAEHVATIEAMIKRLQDRKSLLEHRAQRRRDALCAAIQIANLTSLSTALGTIVPVAGKPAVRITDEGAVPASFMREKVTRTPDKAAIGKALSAGQHIPGCELSNGAPTIAIRRR